MAFRNAALFFWYCRYTNGTLRVTLIRPLGAASHSWRLKRELLGIFFRIPFRMSLLGGAACCDAMATEERRPCCGQSRNGPNVSDEQHHWLQTSQSGLDGPRTMSPCDWGKVSFNRYTKLLTTLVNVTFPENVNLLSSRCFHYHFTNISACSPKVWSSMMTL